MTVEVDTALSSQTRLAEQAEQAEAAAAAYDAATRAEARYASRYRVGAVAFRTWLDAQEARRAAERALAEIRRQQYEVSVTLVRALGGGGGAPSPGS